MANRYIYFCLLVITVSLVKRAVGKELPDGEKIDSNSASQLAFLNGYVEGLKASNIMNRKDMPTLPPISEVETDLPGMNAKLLKELRTKTILDSKDMNQMPHMEIDSLPGMNTKLPKELFIGTILDNHAVHNNKSPMIQMEAGLLGMKAEFPDSHFADSVGDSSEILSRTKKSVADSEISLLLGNLRSDIELTAARKATRKSKPSKPLAFKILIDVHSNDDSSISIGNVRVIGVKGKDLIVKNLELDENIDENGDKTTVSYQGKNIVRENLLSTRLKDVELQTLLSGEQSLLRSSYETNGGILIIPKNFDIAQDLSNDPELQKITIESTKSGN